MTNDIKKLSFIFILCLIASLSQAQNQSYSYLALGDSYTIGEKVSVDARWPVQLVDSLRKRGITIQDPKIIAKTGWTTDELIQGIKNTDDLADQYDLVSLLIGVNNQYRGYDFATYKKEFTQLLERAIRFADGKPEQVFVVSIPDYGVTPFGQQKNPEKIARELAHYNAIARKISAAHDVSFVNITPGSKKTKTDLNLVASDNLHPSAKMYQQWVRKALPVALSKLK